MPKVSVIIPVYNTEKYIRQCLDSVVNQTLKDIEIICVNDGSTDKSWNILKEYASNDARIKLINQNNHGQSYARNRALEIVSGDYIYMLDSDDEIALNTLEELYQIACKNSLDIVYFESRPIYETKELEEKFNTFKSISKRTREYKGIRRGLDMFVDMVENHDYSVSVCRQLISKNYHRNINLYFHEGILHEDNLFTFLSMIQASRVMHIPKEYFYRRVRPESTMTKKESYQNFEGYFICYTNMLAFALMHRFDDRANRAILKQIRAVYNSAKRIYQNLPPNEKMIKISKNYGPIVEFMYKQFIESMKYTSIPIAEGTYTTPAIKVTSTADSDSEDAIRARYFEDELNNVRRSLSFRIGRTITFIPRKIRGGIRCYEENGLQYTICRISFKTVLFMKKLTTSINIKNNLKKKSKDNTTLNIKETKIYIPNKYNYYKSLNPQSYPDELKSWYFSRTGCELNLNNPQTFNEKIQWMKLYESTNLKTILADKYLVRDWIKEKIGEQYLIPILGVWDNFDEIDFDKLPDKFVLKANHGSGWNIIVKDKRTFNKAKAKRMFDTWMSINFAFFGFEMHYKKIKPKIIAEQYIQNDGDLYDYKFLCFNGKIKYIWVDSKRFTNHKRDIFDLDWNLQPFTIQYPNSDIIPQKPEKLDQIIELVKKLCKSFAHVRVDFYEVNEKIYFGEMTFTSGSGTERISPPSQDLLLGQMIDLKMCDSKIQVEDNPLVSVIIPVHNAEKYIDECVSSIRNQTLKNIEIILVDDGSTDNSLSMLYEYAKIDDRIRVLCQKQKFAGVARNFGFEQARGDYVIFLDSDDFFDKTLLEKTYYEAHTSDADIVIFGAKKYNHKTKKISDAPWLLKKDRIPSKKPFSSSVIPKYIFDIVTPCPWTKIFKRSFILENNLKFQDTQNSNDVLFVFTALAIAEKIVAVEDDLVYYRVGRDDNLQATKYKNPLDFIEAYSALKSSLIARNVFKKVEQSYVNATLSGCLYNLHTTLDKNVHQLLYTELKNRIFYELEFTRYPKDYFYSRVNYDEMNMILTSPYEEYVKFKHLTT